jgi:hypothetical protein
MYRSIVLLAAFCLFAGCAHTSSTPKSETNQLANDILLGDSQHPTCARGEISYCRVTRASHFSNANATSRCECVQKSLFNAPTRSPVTGPSPGTRVR